MITAQRLHRLPMVRSVVISPTPVMATRATGRWSTTRDVTLALLLALGLSTAFFSPVQPRVSSATSNSGSAGRILGVSTTAPLTITAVVIHEQSEWRLTLSPAPNTLVEVMSRMATAAGSTMEYRSLNNSMYLTKFLGLGDDATGRWQVSINGVIVTDLSLPVLQQGDDVRIERLLP